MDNTVGTIGSLYLGVNNRAVRNLRDSLVLSPEQSSLIYGTLLGDGSIIGNQANKQKNYRLQIGHSKKQKELVLWKYEILKDFVIKPPSYKKINNSWMFRTISHPQITEIYHLFYKDGKKILPPNIEEILKDKLSLAVWYMDDGCKSLRKGEEEGLILNTQSFRLNEVENLSVIIENLYRIKTGIHRDHNRFRLYVNKRQRYQFSNLIKEYIIDILRYKLPKDP